MRKCCTLFLLLVLTIQVLPVRQLGSVLFGNQFTEELPHSLDTEKDSCCKKLNAKSDFLSADFFSLQLSFIDLHIEHTAIADAIPVNHTGDIDVPPPNC